MSEYETRMKRCALKLLAVALEGEPAPDVATLMTYHDLARNEVEEAANLAEQAVGMLKASPGPVGMDGRVSRFKEIVAALSKAERSFWDDENAGCIVIGG